MMNLGWIDLRGGAVALASVAVLLSSCGDEETKSVDVERAFDVEPSVILITQHGAISATGSVRQDTLTITATRPGTARLLVGRDCESGVSLQDGIALSANTPAQVTISATGPLAAEGLYTVQACFTDDRGKNARSAVQIEVDNTAPVIMSTSPAGEYCGPQWIQFFCTDCFVLGYSTTGEVTVSPDGTVTGGTAYRGERIFVGADTTIRYAGVDVAGNQATGTVVIDISSGPGLSDVAVGNRYLSANGRTSTTLSFTTTSGLDYVVVDDATNCDNGSVIAAGTTVNGTNNVTIDAFDVDNGDNDVLVCVRAPAGCPGGQSTIVTRKDNSLGWTFSPSLGTSWNVFTFQYLYPRDQTLVLTSPTFAADYYVDGNAIGVREAFSTSALADPTPANRYLYVYDQDFMLPENADGQVALTFTGLTDEAQNDLPDPFFSVTFGPMNEALPINRGTFTANGAVVIGPTNSQHWLRCPVGQTYDSTGDVCTGTATTHNWIQAMNACAALNTALFNGRNGWRLPFVSELAAVVDPDAAVAPYTDAAFTMPTETRFWSNTGQDSSQAYAMNFANAAAVRTSKSTSLSVRCVSGHNRSTRQPFRASWDTFSSTYVPNTSGPVVVEPASNLDWEQSPSTATYIAANALTACSTRHGSSGWRLPTAAHFTSIMALRYGANGYLTGVTFGGAASNTSTCYWIAGATGLCFNPSSGVTQSAGSSHPVWCVREKP